MNARPDIRVTTYAGPGAEPEMRVVPWPAVPKKGALIKIGACGVCGTDQHILKGHWPKPLPWPFTLGHELAGVDRHMQISYCQYAAKALADMFELDNRVLRVCHGLPIHNLWELLSE